MGTSSNFRWLRRSILQSLTAIVGGSNYTLPLALLLLSLSLQAGPITEISPDWTPAAPQVSGYAQAYGDITYFDLWNLPGDSNDQTVTLTFSQPVLGFGAWWDNRPDEPGTGMCVMGDCIGDAVAYVGFYAWVSDIPFQSIVLYTQMAHPGAIREHGFFTDVVVLTKSSLLMSTLPYEVSTVPEPGSFVLAASGLGLLFWRRSRKRSFNPR